MKKTVQKLSKGILSSPPNLFLSNLHTKFAQEAPRVFRAAFCNFQGRRVIRERSTNSVETRTA